MSIRRRTIGCAAGEPHYEVFSGEVEIIERENEFEIRSKDNVVVFSGTKVLPVPNVTYFTSDQNPFLLKGLSGGYSDREGAEAAIVLGSTYNDLGGAVHHFLTGRPAEEFRGDWQLGLGYVSKRGFPIDADIDYRGGDLYFGRTFGFYLNDQGQNIGDIRNELDGTLITNKDRTLLSTENRIQIDDATRLDIQAFDARDAAVYSEFFRDQYYKDERPETDLYLRHSRHNYIGTAEGRWNLASFSYADGRELEATFTEKLPLVTFNLFSQPLVEFPDGTPLLLTTETGVGQFRSKFDSTVVNPVPQETTRLDQEVDLSAPFQLGPFSLRPFIGARYTYYEETIAGGSQDRWAFTGGAELATRIARTWKWTEGESSYGIQHELVPKITYSQTWGNNLDPSDYFQFDPIDAIQPFTVIRVGLLQRLLDSFSTEGTHEINDFVWLDLGQNFRPVSSENNGSHLGLFDFEFIFWPERFWLPLVDWKFLVEGQYDWDTSEFRTFNTYTQFPVLGINWFGEYRTDQTEDGKGQVGYGAQTKIRGRWSLLGRSLYDLMAKQNISYDVRLTRDDHDWRFTIGVRFDNVTDAVSLTVNFEPKIGGLFRPGFRRYTSAPVYGGGDYVRWR